MLCRALLFSFILLGYMFSFFFFDYHYYYWWKKDIEFPSESVVVQSAASGV
jgi:hypothetical protein